MLKPIEFQFTASDRIRFGCAAWLPFHVDAFVDVPLSTLRAWDATVQEALGGVKLFQLLRGEDVDLSDMETIAVATWLALKLSKPDAPSFADFDPQLIGVTKRPVKEAVGGDADPPAQSSAGASAETPPQAKAKRSPSRGTSKS